MDFKANGNKLISQFIKVVLNFLWLGSSTSSFFKLHTTEKDGINTFLKFKYQAKQNYNIIDQILHKLSTVEISRDGMNQQIWFSVGLQ